MIGVVLWLLLNGSAAVAVDVRWDHVEDDLITGQTQEVAEDEDGFLWFATRNGLVRYDGERSRLVEPTDQPVSAYRVTTALGRVFTATRAGLLYVVADDVLEPVTGPDGEHLLASRTAGTEDALWAFSNGALIRMDRDGDWVDRTPGDLPTDAYVYHLRVVRGGVLMATHTGLWRVSDDGSTTLVRPGRATDAAELSDGRMVVYGNGTLLLDGDQERLLLEHQGHRMTWLAVRDDVIYLAYDVLLFRITPDGHVDAVTRRRSGGPPLRENGFVSSDGTLWTGSVRLPEPDTRTWGYDEGITELGRYITVGPDGTVYNSTWTGLSTLSPVGPNPEHPLRHARTTMVCVDARGRALTFAGLSGEHDILDLNTAAVVVPGARGSDCAPARTGSIWMIGYGHMWEIHEDGWDAYDTPKDAHRGIIETEDGTLVTVGHTSACEAKVDDVRARRPDPWTCTDLGPGVGPNVVCAVEAQPGLVWACTEGDGVWERTAPNQWRASPINALLDNRSVNRAEMSESGGVWLEQARELVRVQHGPEGWSVAERIGSRVGLPPGTQDVDEDAEGNLWVSGRRGVSRVPAHRRVRHTPEFPPRLVASLVDGVAVDEVIVPDGSVVELQFAALAYRYPRSLRYRWRLGAGDWSSPARSGTIRLAGLASGAVDLQVATTVDGTSWSAPATVEVTALPAWYERPWVWAILAMSVGAVMFWVQRLRARVAIETERQRARIAMDLHDELGAGLGSISILAGMLTSDRVPVDRAREAAKRIASDAEQLGGSVTDIVWSLRTKQPDLATLITYLLDRAQGMIDRDQVRLRPDLPDPMPRVTMRPAVARAAQLVMVEALYNAARHAGASEIVVRVRNESGRWAVAVLDDGVGVDAGPETRPGGGTGLDSMKERAAQIGARLVVETRASGGTEVRLVLPR